VVSVCATLPTFCLGPGRPPRAERPDDKRRACAVAVDAHGIEVSPAFPACPVLATRFKMRTVGLILTYCLSRTIELEFAELHKATKLYVHKTFWRGLGIVPNKR
jgi:hypothetical protein